MGGLIPLLLKPVAAGSRGSIVFPINKPASSNASAPQSTVATATPVSPAVSPKSRTWRRLSMQTPASLPVLPYTSAEWSKAVSEVKRQYMNRKYRPCSLRCCEILDNIKESASIEPAYLIYLHFYAASSFDMLSRPLRGTSPYRTKLLQQARDHYTQASNLSKAADETMARSSRPSSAATSSMHSPSSSVSSRASSRTWTNSTALSSPTPSVYSVEEAVNNKLSNHQAPQKKRVTFCEAPEEPFIRPDSPTLGFEDFLCAPQENEPRYLPVLPEEPEPADEPEEMAKPPTPEPLNEDCDAFDFLQERSIHRYCGLLSSLRSQIAVHIADIEEQLATPSQTIPSVNSFPTRAATPELSDELRSLDIKARIERLRQSNWQRRRFDASRYEALRESVLAELS
ncbi:hypothetical protein CTA2_4542 [Colletotrichum tanaceti]|uniref:Uncharacterized protein n=1 Tax=Colletotrichum tanaceti TaxID=1306861 RepID=A0A4U6XKL8_9PEZI|nr:hypothetical protein CTA2_4543 [Colletotrichum tanaceti]KAJ0168556.1 hypothetical protein CTA2_4542 [Colletotrichum tanaceti]TKW55687.1 hypothetical protein CTA1_9641 [Colletotrichum tanaceti]